jgi:drug/metabolite transporter (DMT)-like permease
MKTKPIFRTYLAFMLITLIWGFYYLGIDLLLKSGWDPHFLNGLRFLSGGLILLAIALALGKKEKIVQIQKENPTRLLIFVVVGFVMSIGFLTAGQETVSSGISGVLVSTSPLFVALLGLTAFFGRKRVHSWTWVGVIIGLIGVIILYAPWSDYQLNSTGVIFLLIGSIMVALEASLFNKWFAKEDLISITALSLTWAGAIFLIIAVLFGQFETGSWLIFIFMVVFSNIIAYLAYLWLINHSGPIFANVYAYIVPVIALLAGFLLNSEPMTALIIFGSGLAVSGAILVGLKK